MNANERFEYMADRFYKKTGMLAPGKDCPAELARSAEDVVERDMAWREFIEDFSSSLFQTHADMYDALETIKRHILNMPICDPHLYGWVEENIDPLLKRARDE